jgi:signal transduction histidine kinase
MKFIRDMQAFWHKCIEIGVDKQQDADIIERILATNRIAIINTFLTVQGGLFVHYLLPYYELSVPVVILGFLNLLSLLMNYLGKHVIARALPWLIATIGIFYCGSVFGYESGLHVLYIIVIIGAIMAHSDAALSVHLILIGLSVFFSILLFVTDFHLFKPENINISPITQKSIAINVYGIAIVSTIVATFFYIYRTHLFNQKIITSRNELGKRYVELEKVNQEMDNFVYSVSHDLRAPIVSALGLVSIALDETELDKIKYYLSLEERSLLKLDKFISEILVYSRNSRTEVLCEEIIMEQIIADIMEFQKLDLPSSPVKMKVEMDTTMPFYSDSKRLYAILNNLISNGVRYKNKNNVDAFVHVSVQISPEKAIVKVIDNGIGIEEKHLPKIFEMFYRAHTRSEGSGLGLYIVREVVEKLKGKIWVDSQVGEGTTFYLEVPNSNPQRSLSA